MKEYGWIGLSVAVGTIVLVALPVRVTPGLSVELRFAKQQYFVGEAIPFELCYRSTIPGRYRLDLATYDRSGRLPNERFGVAPAAGWRDPLRAFLESGLPTIAGGLRTHAVLTERPQCVPLWLDDWVRFERPGRYRLAVRSVRTVMMSSPARFTFAAISPAVELEIAEPPPGWASRQLREYVRRIDAASDWSVRADAVRGLAALETEESIAALVARHWMSPLITVASRRRGAVRRAIESRMADPSAAIGLELIDIWATLRYLDEPGSKKQDARAAWGRRRKEAAKLAARSLQDRRGDSWADTYEAIRLVDPALAPRPEFRRREEWAQLTDGELTILLEEHGDRLRDPVWFETLKGRLRPAPSHLVRDGFIKWARLTNQLIRRMKQVDAVQARAHCAQDPQWRIVWEQIEKEP